MASEIVIPPIQPVAPSYPIAGASVAVSSTAAKISSTDYDCYGVVIQSSTQNDSAATKTNLMYVVKVDDSALIWELTQGESVFIPCKNTSELKVKCQGSDTAHARVLIFRAQQ